MTCAMRSDGSRASNFQSGDLGKGLTSGIIFFKIPRGLSLSTLIICAKKTFDHLRKI